MAPKSVNTAGRVFHFLSLMLATALIALWFSGCAASGGHPASSDNTTESGALAVGSNAAKNRSGGAELTPPQDLPEAFLPAWEKYQEGLQYSSEEDWLSAQESLDSAVLLLLTESVESDAELTEEDLAWRARLGRDILLSLEMVYPGLASLGDPDTSWTEIWPEVSEDAPDQQLVQKELSILDTLDLSGFSIPVVLNERVLHEIHYFTERVPSFTRGSLSRKTLFEDMIRAKIRERGFPEELIYLAFVESGFKVHAYSHAHASGLWQFIPATGRRYGLESDWWVDMRRNPEMATDAALSYLGDLYEEFGDWLLAMAAYNTGEGRIRRIIRQTGNRNYWEMKLHRETMHYVPRILAAMIIGKHPYAWGFEIDTLQMAEHDTATVRHCMPLAMIADSLNIPVDSLKMMNRELLRWCTPPNGKKFTLRLPKGTRDHFVRAYAQMDTTRFTKWHRHKIRYGENLSVIADKYGIPLRSLMDANNLRSHRIRAGQYLIVPLPIGAIDPRKTAASSAGGKEESSKEILVMPPKGTRYKLYTVRQGDNLYDISRKFGVSLKALTFWNGLKSSALSIGQKLRVYDPDEIAMAEKASAKSTPSSSAPKSAKSAKSAMSNRSAALSGQTYTVRSGDNLFAIGQRFGASVQDLKDWNQLSSGSIYPGQKLLVSLNSSGSQTVSDAAAVSGANASSVLWHTVKSGDTLWDISRKYGVSVEDIQGWNSLQGGRLNPGKRLKIKVR